MECDSINNNSVFENFKRIGLSDIYNAWYSLNFVPTNKFTCFSISFFRTWYADLVWGQLGRAVSKILPTLARSFVGGHQIGAARKVGLSPTRANK